MNELNTYQNLAGKVLKSAVAKKRTKGTDSQKIQNNEFIEARLQELLAQNSLDNLIKLLFKTVSSTDSKVYGLQIFYQKFTQILLHIIAETKFAKNINITSDEFLEIIRVSLEEQLNSLQFSGND